MQRGRFFDVSLSLVNEAEVMAWNTERAPEAARSGFVDRAVTPKISAVRETNM